MYHPDGVMQKLLLGLLARDSPLMFTLTLTSIVYETSFIMYIVISIFKITPKKSMSGSESGSS